jgi:hypothetical protein
VEINTAIHAFAIATEESPRASRDSFDSTSPHRARARCEEARASTHPASVCLAELVPSPLRMSG